MARKVLFKLDPRGVAELLTSRELRSNLRARAEAVSRAAGDGHDVLDTSTNRARYTVMAKSDEAQRAEAESHTLTRAINAARG